MSRQPSPEQISIYENSQRMWNISTNWLEW
jgi:hypothetical protein